MHMHFNVSGPLATGVIQLHMIRRLDGKEFEYKTMALEIPGKQRVWLINADKERAENKKGLRMFGVRWS